MQDKKDDDKNSFVMTSYTPDDEMEKKTWKYGDTTQPNFPKDYQIGKFDLFQVSKTRGSVA